jgi:diguanylate cyclase (GGDEF)-like protein
MKVLIADDDVVSRKLVANMLAAWGYEVLLVGDGEHALRLLQAEDGPVLAILDWMMPGIDGPEVCRRIRAVNQQRYIYILLLTARTGAEDLLAGMEAGADDYITKPYNVNELRARIRAGRRIVDLQAEVLTAQQALREQATRDSLTGVWNRSAILDMIGRELARSVRQHSALMLVMADIDHFKQVNDVHGHLVGDEVLKQSTKRLALCIRPYDSIGRYGGEEFIIAVPGCDRTSGVAHAERLRAAIDLEPFVVGATHIFVTCSFGIAFTDTSECAPEALIRAADEALYRAKHNGRNRVEVAA